MKKQFGENGFYLGSNKDLLVSLVSDAPEGDNNHKYEFVVYDLAEPFQSIGLIGTGNPEHFALKFQMQHTQDRFAFAAYVDGVNVCQTHGLAPLSGVYHKESYDAHGYSILIGLSERPKECLYLDTFVQETNESRRLVFTHNQAKGVNTNLISDASAMNKIEVFCWLERKVAHPQVISNTPLFDDNSRSAVGAGEATYKEYGHAGTLSNPLYLGKATFIHVKSAILNVLGDRVVRNPAMLAAPAGKKDMMNKVPLT